MKKYILGFFLLIGSVFISRAQKTFDDSNAQKRTVGSFHGIEVATGIELILTPGNTEEVAVSASKDEFRERIITRVENGLLKIYYDNKFKAMNFKKEKKDLRAYVSYRSLDRLDATTGATVEIDGTLTAPLLKMNVNTGATVKGKIDVQQLDINQGTGSIVTLSGQATQLKADGDTGSMFKGSDLHSDNCQATTSTGAGIYITVEKELSVKANTGGFVKYKGSGGIREVRTTTGGAVSRI
jgi:hypothetical protein